jgi:uncharacterized alkaline shock family protein YloU
MRILTILGVIFYASVLVLIGTTMIVFSLNFLQIQDISNILSVLQSSFDTKLALSLSGLLLILISFSFANLILGRFQREKTIAFSTPAGPVTIALSAVEDLIKRMGHLIPQIKELRPNVVAKKNKIETDLRVILKSEANIPELTSQLQEITRVKMQEVLGIEEQIIVRIHIAKIAATEEREKKKKDFNKEEPAIPFGSYGRV